METNFDYGKRAQRNLEEKTLKDCDVHFIVSLSKCSVAAGAKEVLRAVKDAVMEESVTGADVGVTGCGGMCHAEPMVTVRRTGRSDVVYGSVTPEKAQAIVIAHGLYDKLISPWILNKSLEVFD